MDLLMNQEVFLVLSKFHLLLEFIICNGLPLLIINVMPLDLVNAHKDLGELSVFLEILILMVFKIVLILALALLELLAHLLPLEPAQPLKPFFADTRPHSLDLLIEITIAEPVMDLLCSLLLITNPLRLVLALKPIPEHGLFGMDVILLPFKLLLKQSI